jgi:hypothetical protein
LAIFPRPSTCDRAGSDSRSTAGFEKLRWDAWTWGPLPNPRRQALKGDRRSVVSHTRPVVAEPPKPDGLGPVASATWDQVVPELTRLGLVGWLDGPMVELFCTSFERWRAHDGGPGYASLTAVVARAARDLGWGRGRGCGRRPRGWTGSRRSWRCLGVCCRRRDAAAASGIRRSPGSHGRTTR